MQGDRLARLKNDKGRREVLAQLLRADLFPEAWIAPPAARQLRALLRHRVQLVRLRTLLRNGSAPCCPATATATTGRPGAGAGRAGNGWPRCPCSPFPREVAGDGVALTGALEARIDQPGWQIHQRARRDPRVKVLTQLPGWGRSPRWSSSPRRAT